MLKDNEKIVNKMSKREGKNTVKMEKLWWVKRTTTKSTLWHQFSLTDTWIMINNIKYFITSSFHVIVWTDAAKHWR